MAIAMFLVCLTADGARARAEGAQTQAARATASAIDEAHLPAPAYPKVLALAQAGKPAQALVQLDEQLHEQGATATPIEARLLRAHLLADAGRAGDSAAAWRAIAAENPALHDFALRSAFSTLIAGGLLNDASALADDWASAHRGQADPMWLVDLASAFEQAKDDDRAVALYQRVLAGQATGPAADSAGLALAAIRARQHDTAGALDLLHRTELGFDSPATFLSAREAEQTLTRSSGAISAPFTADQYASLVARLNGRTRYQPALALLEEWAASPAAAGRAEEIANTRVATLYAMRADAEAMAAANQFLHTYPESRFVPDVRTIQFRLDVREQRTRSVKSRGLALWLGHVPGVSRADRFSLGRLLAAYLVSVGEVSQGLSLYHRLYREATSRADRADILWRAGVAAIRVHQFSRAKSNLQGALDLEPGPLTERLCRYWLAVVDADQGRTRAALDTAIGLIHENAYDYYGMEALKLAARLVKGHAAWADDVRQAQAPEQAFPTLTLQPATRQDAGLIAATALARAGLVVDAAEFARDTAERQRTDPAMALLAARALSAVGRHSDAVSLLGRRFSSFLDEPATGVPDDFWSLVYPRAFWPDVRAAAAVNHVDPLLLLAIMRQESKFDATAVSRNGALGLFQMMTYTAAELGAGEDPPERADLLKPRVSAQLGARLVKRLWTQFKGAAAPIVASYNAGEDLVALWWKTIPGASEALFVDTMPYSETRNYARAVLTNYYAYQRLYGQVP
jgi:soluble lytic murein transglycosylase